MKARSTKKRYAFDPDYAVAPGLTLQETIESLGMTQAALARRTGIAAKTANEIIKGKAPITPGTAVLLERVTGLPARMWNNLERTYREQLAKIADRERLATDQDWLKTIPTGELIRRGAFTAQPDKLELLHAVLRFFGVGSLEQWRRLWTQPTGAFRKSQSCRAELGAVATWLRLGELKAQSIKAKPFDKKRFRAALDDIRDLTLEKPELFCPKMVSLCAAGGVVVVFVREIKKCPSSGVARWLSPSKALIQLSLRYKTDDQFWFSFFHEAGHILNDPKKVVYIDDADGEDGEQEERANRFAGEILIPREFNSTLQELTKWSLIVEFSQSIRISPGIVLGRLQKAGIIPWRTALNTKLKRHFEWLEK